MMGRKFIQVLIAALAVHVISARVMCPSHPNCVCGGTFAIELNCNIDGRVVKMNVLPSTYINIKCENTTTLDYSQLPKCANGSSTFKSVSFKDCPLPKSSFKDILMHMGVNKTMSLIFQNAKELSGYFERKHFAGLQDLTKLLLSVNGVQHLPDNLFVDIHNLTWLNIRCNNIRLSEELFKPLERLETLEISHNHMTNMSSNIFSHLSLLRKLSLWQNNVTKFSKDFFSSVDVLEELDLSSTGLNELPTSIFKPLRKLKKLTLFSNKFATLPQKLFSSNKKLETVIVLNNDVKMKELPKNLFGNLPNLKQVHIQRSGIEIVPYDIFTNSSLITNISLAFNDIEVIPESTFNDQINLLELDLSHNNLTSLEPKLFSSLVRLEKLNLCYNAIEEISGSTFSSLLSLTYLNMEHNNLKTISSYLFSNNKQRMSISLAYNELDFQNKELQNDSIKEEQNQTSPFAHTYNLRLLNLSHNKFRFAFEDWWINGHEILDISNNFVQLLWQKENDDEKPPSYKKLVNKPIKEIWITNNPLECECVNFFFIEYIMDTFHANVIDDTVIHCFVLWKARCYESFRIPIQMGAVAFTLSWSLCYTIYFFRDQISVIIKNKLYFYYHHDIKEQEKNIVIKYSENDEEFVLQEILPELKEHKNFNIQMKCIGYEERNENFLQKFKGSSDSNIVLVIFSPNYLTSVYSDVDIKKIRGEMLKSEDTIYVFADVGPDNSVYAFLKEQRDEESTILWSDPNFWSLLIHMLSTSAFMKTLRIATNYDIHTTLDPSYCSPGNEFLDPTPNDEVIPPIFTSVTDSNKQV